MNHSPRAVNSLINLPRRLPAPSWRTPVFLVAILCSCLASMPVLAQSAPNESPTIERAASFFALGSLDAAEAELRRFLSTFPDSARKDEAIRFLAEVRVERERERISTTTGGHSGVSANVESDRTVAPSSPRIVDPSILSSPPQQVLLKWELSFPGAPAQYRRDGVYAITASGEGRVTTIRVFLSGGGAEVATQRNGTMLSIDIPGLVDALPRGGLDIPQGAAVRVRHSQLTAEPLVARVVIDLRSADVKATVTSGNDEVLIVLEEATPSAEASAPQGGLYRPAVTSDRYRLEIRGGNFQRVLVGDVLPEPLVVRVTDPATGAVVPNATIAFRAVDAGVTFTRDRAATSSDGIADVRATLDRVAGRKVIVAAVPGTPAEVSFEIYALPRPPDSIRKVSGEDAKVRSRQTSTEPLVVAVQDVYGNPIPGVKIDWGFVQGGGTVDADVEKPGLQSEIETDNEGRAVLRSWTTGPRAGSQKLQAAFTTGEITRSTQFTLEVLPQLVSMDFFQTPVPDILRFLGRIANWNLIVSDGVSALQEATATVHFENMPIDDALDKILAMKNLARIEESDGSIKIVTFIEAQTMGQSVVTDPAQLDVLPQDMVRTVVLNVHPRSDFAATVGAIQPFLTASGKVLSDAPSRKIVITDYVSVSRRVRDVLSEFEKAEDRRVLTFENLNFASEELKKFVSEQIPTEVKSFFNGRSAIFLGPTNAIDRLEQILRTIDSSDAFVAADDAAPGKQFEIIPLRSQKATELVGILKEVFTTQRAQQFLTSTNIRNAERAAAAQTATTPTTGQTGQAAPAQAAPTDIVGQAFRELKDEVRMSAEPKTNSLILFGYPSDIAIVKQVVERLDSLDIAKEPVTREKVAIIQVRFRTSGEILAAVRQIMGLDGTGGTDPTNAANRSGYWLDWWYTGRLTGVGATTTATATGARPQSMTETQPLPLKLFEIIDPNLIIIVGGTKQERDLVVGLIEDLDKSLTRTGNYLQVYTLDHMLPSEFNKLLDKTLLSDQIDNTDWLYWWYYGRSRSNTGEIRRMPLDASRLILVWAKREIHQQIDELKRQVDSETHANLNDLTVKKYTVSAGDIYAAANILTRSSLNQTEGVSDEFLFVNRDEKQLVVWARGDAHLRIERLLPQIDRPELTFDPLLKYELYEFRNISVAEVIGVTTAGERDIVEGAAGGGAAGARSVSSKTILELISEPLGTEPGRGIYPSITGNFILVWGPPGVVDRSVEFARQIDRRWEKTKIQVRTYTIQHGDPKTVASFINASIFAQIGASATAGGAANAPPSTEFLVLDPALPKKMHIWALPATHDRIRDYLSTIDTDAFNFTSFKIFRIPGLSRSTAQDIIRGVAPNATLFQVGDLWVIVAELATLQKLEDMVRAITRPDTEPIKIRYLQLTRLTTADMIPVLAPRFGISIGNTEFSGRAIFYINSDEELRKYEEFRTAQRSRPPLTILVMDKQNLLILMGDDIYVDQAEEFVTDIENATSGRPRLVKLRHVSPTIFKTTLLEIYPNMRTFDIGRNDAIVVMELEDTRKVDELLSVIDRSPLEGETVPIYDIVQLRNRAAGEVQAAITQLLPTLGSSSGRSNTPLTVYAITDANALIITGGNAEERSLVEKIAGEMDAEPYRKDFYVQLYAFKYILPSEFEKFLTATVVDEKTVRTRIPAADGEPAQTTTEMQTNAKRIPIDSLKLLIVRTEREIHQQIAELIALIDTPGFGTRLEVRARNYPVKNASLDVIANIITRQTLNQFAGSADEFLIIDRTKRELVIWAREGAHTKIERLLPVYDRAEIQFDPDDEFDSYVLQYVSLPLVEAGIQIIAQVQAILGPGRVVYSAGGAAGNFVLMWGNRAAISRAKETLRRLDMAVKDQVGGESNVRFVEIHHRPVAELAVELKGIWGLNTNMVTISQADGSPTNGIMLFVPHAMLPRILNTIEALDTFTPTRILKASYLSVQNDLVAVITTAFKDLRTMPVGVPGAGLEMLICQGSRSRLDELERLWNTIDTVGVQVVYRPVNRTPDELKTAVQAVMPQLGLVSIAATAGPSAMLVFGEAVKVQQGLDLLRKFDITGDVRLLRYGRMAAADAQTLLTSYYPSISVELIAGGSILAALGNAEALNSAERLLKDIEAGLRWKILPLTRMTALEASTLITSVFGSVKVTQLPAGNGVVLLGTEVNLAEAVELIHQIDIRKVQMVPVREADIASVATAVTTFYPEAQITAMPEISTIAISGDSQMIAEIERFIKGIDRKVFTAIRPLKFYDPTTSGELTQLQTTIQTYLSATGSIFFDRQSNAFIMTDALEKVERALKVIDDLDRQPPQFIIEAVIAEIAVTDDKNLGFTWAMSPDLAPLNFLPQSNPPLTAPTWVGGGARADFQNGTFTLGLARTSLQATIQALLQKQDGRIVATPKIVTRNNVQGVVNIQKNIPYTTSIPATTTTPATTAIAFQEVPIVLTVTPSSTWYSNSIRMTVQADISVRDGAATTSGAVPVSSRIVNTTVDMSDGQTLIIGGLMQKIVSEVVSKIPILGDIPGLGKIFRSSTNNEINSEVLIFLCPRIIYPATQELQMEEELNRFKYLVNFPADWSGRRWLSNNAQRSPGLRQQQVGTSNFIVTPPGTSMTGTSPSSAVISPSTTAAPTAAVGPSFLPAPVSAAPSTTPAPTYTPQPQIVPPSAVVGSTTTFDVNSASAADFRRIPGMPPHVAELIVKYREANGAYSTMRDLLKVPGMTSDLLDASAKYLRFGAAGSNLSPAPVSATEMNTVWAPAPAPAATAQPSTPSATAPAAAAVPAATQPQAARSGLVNINTATIDELKTLPGIMDNHARMIVAYRNTYGAFTTTDQLIDVPGISPEMYGRIRELITARAVAAAPAASTYVAPTVSPRSQKINVNDATEQQLLAIPGFSMQNVKLIIAYRQSYGRFHVLDELLQVPTLTPEIVEKVRPYLTANGTGTNASSTPAASSSPSLVNLNTATEQQLKTVPGFTEQNVKLIIAYRNSYGTFTSVDDLVDVPSITPEIMAKVRAYLTVR